MHSTSASISWQLLPSLPSQGIIIHHWLVTSNVIHQSKDPLLESILALLPSQPTRLSSFLSLAVKAINPQAATPSNLSLIAQLQHLLQVATLSRSSLSTCLHVFSSAIQQAVISVPDELLVWPNLPSRCAKRRFKCLKTLHQFCH